jgi:hypothetical protein
LRNGDSRRAVPKKSTAQPHAAGFGGPCNAQVCSTLFLPRGLYWPRLFPRWITSRKEAGAKDNSGPSAQRPVAPCVMEKDRRELPSLRFPKHNAPRLRGLLDLGPMENPSQMLRPRGRAIGAALYPVSGRCRSAWAHACGEAFSPGRR